MATPSLFQVMEAIAERAKTVAKLRSEPEIVSSIRTPFLMVGLPPIPSYRATFGRGIVLLEDWPLYILTSAKVNAIGQERLAEYASWTGPKSIVRALEDEPTLGGVCLDLQVNSFRPLGLEEVGIISYFGGEMRITVELSGEED